MRSLVEYKWIVGIHFSSLQSIKIGKEDEAMFLKMRLALCEDYFHRRTNSSNMACTSLGLVLDQCKHKSHGILRILYSHSFSTKPVPAVQCFLDPQPGCNRNVYKHCRRMKIGLLTAVQLRRTNIVIPRPGFRGSDW